MNILVVRLSALGDVAMTIPAIYSCAKTWPAYTFHVLTTAFCAQLFIQPPKNVQVHTLQKPVSTWKMLRQLQQMDIDVVADLHNVLRSWVIDLYYTLKGKRVAILQKQRKERHRILKRHQETATPFTQRYFDVFQHLGLATTPQFTSLFPIPPAIPQGWEKTSEERWIGIAPFARYRNKTYPLERMREVVEQLAALPHTHVFLFGAKGQEAAQLQQWTAIGQQVTSLAGQLPLAEELALMTHLDVMVTMDSSNMHLASLVGTRVVSIWGSTAPACGFLGWQQHTDDALCRHLGCQPCTIAGSENCKKGNLVCMDIAPQEIVSHLKRML